MASKAQQIRALYDGVRTTAEIAAIVDCLPAYVRVVARQRELGTSNTDRRYRKKPSYKEYHRNYQRAYQTRRYAEDPVFRAIKKERNRANKARAKEARQ